MDAWLYNAIRCLVSWFTLGTFHYTVARHRWCMGILLQSLRHEGQQLKLNHCMSSMSNPYKPFHHDVVSNQLLDHIGWATTNPPVPLDVVSRVAQEQKRSHRSW